MATKKEKVEFTKPTSQLDLEARLGEDAPEKLHETVNPVDSALNSEKEDFVGTDPVYQNYGEKHLKPSAATEGPDKAAEDAYFDSFEKGNEAGDQLKAIYGEKTPHTQGSTVLEAQASDDGDSGDGDSDDGDNSNTPSGSSQS